MLQLFRKKPVAEKESAQTDKVAGFIAKAVITIKTSIAGWLAAQEKHLTTIQKKWMLFIFCVCMSAIAGTFLYRGLFLHNHIPWFKPQPVIILPTQSLPYSLRFDSLDLDSLTHDILRELRREQQKAQSKTDSIYH